MRTAKVRRISQKRDSLIYDEILKKKKKKKVMQRQSLTPPPTSRSVSDQSLSSGHLGMTVPWYYVMPNGTEYPFYQFGSHALAVTPCSLLPRRREWEAEKALTQHALFSSSWSTGVFTVLVQSQVWNAASYGLLWRILIPSQPDPEQFQGSW